MLMVRALTWESQRKLSTFPFSPCTCHIGLQQSESRIDCECVCDPKLQQNIANCFQESGIIELKTNIWIGVANSTNGTGYILHDCPFDYCVEKPVNISLNSSQERDRQCAAFNRSGNLCGQCQEGLSLVLATSKCKECSDIYLLLLIPFALAGIMLVFFHSLLQHHCNKWNSLWPNLLCQCIGCKQTHLLTFHYSKLSDSVYIMGES